MKTKKILILLAIFTSKLLSNSYTYNLNEFINISGIDSLRQHTYNKYFIYYLPQNFLRTCIDSKLNIIMKQNKRKNPNSYQLIIISNNFHPNKHLKKYYEELFLTQNIIFDVNNLIQNYFLFDCEAELICLDSNFREIYRDCGFLNELKYSDKSIFNSILKFETKEEFPIVNIDNIKYNPETNTLYILDKLTNIIHYFNFKTGKNITAFRKERKYFSNNIINKLSKGEKKIFDLYNSLKLNIPIINDLILDKKNYNVYISVNQIKNIENDNNHYRPIEGLTLYEIKNKNNLKEIKLKINNKIDELNIISKFKELLFFDAVNQNSLYSLFIYNLKNHKYFKIIDEKDLENQSAMKISNYDFNYAFKNKNEFYILNIKTNIFIKVTIIDTNNIVLKTIQPQKQLSEIFLANKINKNLQNKYGSSFKINYKYVVNSFIFSNNYIYILLKDQNLSNKFYLQIFKNDKFVKEIKLNISKNGDKLQDIKFVHNIGNKYYFLLNYLKDGLELGEFISE